MRPKSNNVPTKIFVIGLLTTGLCACSNSTGGGSGTGGTTSQGGNAESGGSTGSDTGGRGGRAGQDHVGRGAKRRDGYRQIVGSQTATVMGAERLRAGCVERDTEEGDAEGQSVRGRRRGEGAVRTGDRDGARIARDGRVGIVLGSDGVGLGSADGCCGRATHN